MSSWDGTAPQKQRSNGRILYTCSWDLMQTTVACAAQATLSLAGLPCGAEVWGREPPEGPNDYPYHISKLQSQYQARS